MTWGITSTNGTPAILMEHGDSINISLREKVEEAIFPVGHLLVFKKNKEQSGFPVFRFVCYFIRSLTKVKKMRAEQV